MELLLGKIEAFIEDLEKEYLELERVVGKAKDAGKRRQAKKRG